MFCALSVKRYRASGFSLKGGMEGGEGREGRGGEEGGGERGGEGRGEKGRRTYICTYAERSLDVQACSARTATRRVTSSLHSDTLVCIHTHTDGRLQ